jgi:hypothetical protein
MLTFRDQNVYSSHKTCKTGSNFSTAYFLYGWEPFPEDWFCRKASENSSWIRSSKSVDSRDAVDYEWGLSYHIDSQQFLPRSRLVLTMWQYNQLKLHMPLPKIALAAHGPDIPNASCCHPNVVCAYVELELELCLPRRIHAHSSRNGTEEQRQSDIMD